METMPSLARSPLSSDKKASRMDSTESYRRRYHQNYLSSPHRSETLPLLPYKALLYRDLAQTSTRSSSTFLAPSAFSLTKSFHKIRISNSALTLIVSRTPNLTQPFLLDQTTTGQRYLWFTLADRIPQLWNRCRTRKLLVTLSLSK